MLILAVVKWTVSLCILGGTLSWILSADVNLPMSRWYLACGDLSDRGSIFESAFRELSLLTGDG